MGVPRSSSSSRYSMAGSQVRGLRGSAHSRKGSALNGIRMRGDSGQGWQSRRLAMTCALRAFLWLSHRSGMRTSSTRTRCDWCRLNTSPGRRTRPHDISASGTWVLKPSHASTACRASRAITVPSSSSPGFRCAMASRTRASSTADRLAIQPPRSLGEISTNSTVSPIDTTSVASWTKWGAISPRNTTAWKPLASMFACFDPTYRTVPLWTSPGIKFRAACGDGRGDVSGEPEVGTDACNA
ncbi:hypothetical protein D3C71_1467540 [compost metagenome]